jgi:hypothetical protein
MVVVGAQIIQGHSKQRLAKCPVLTAVLYVATGSDIEEFTAPEAFPGPGIVAAEHFDDMLAVELHPCKQVVFF